MEQPSKKILDILKKEYPIGTRVKLLYMDDAQAPPKFTEGTVLGVDDIGSLLMAWDNGTHLNVLYNCDIVQKI